MNKNLLGVIGRIALPAVLIVSALGFSSPAPATASGGLVDSFGAARAPGPRSPAAAAGGAVELNEEPAGSASLLYLDPWTEQAAPIPNASLDLSAILGVDIHFLHNEAVLDSIKAAGFTWIRMDLDWGTVEHTPGQYNFSRYDRLVADLQARGMRALFILDYGNPPFTGGWDLPPTTPAAIQAFGSFAEAAARHFAGQGVSYEIWNEPNISRFWSPQPDAAQYAALAREVTARVHAGDPAAKVTTAGLSSTDFSFLRATLADGGAMGADAIGLHPYGFDSPEAAAIAMSEWRAIIAQALPANPPTWATEWGYSSAEYGDGQSPQARAEQAVMVARELLTAWSVGFPLVIYYDIRDDGPNPNDPEQNFGLLAQDYTDKPAMQAVRALSGAARGRQLVGYLPVEAPNLHALELSGAADTAVILWADSGKAAVTLPPGASAQNLYGQPVTLHPAGAQLSLTVDSNAGPVYLFFPAKSVIH